MHVEFLVRATPVLRRPEASQCTLLRDAVAHPASSSHISNYRGTSQLQTMRLAHKEGKGNMTTKRNLWLVRLLLVFSLGPVAASLHAQGTVWPASSNQKTIRNEGDAEAVGTITLTTTSTGTIESNSGFTILYTLPIAYFKSTYAVGVSCTGPDAAAICGDITASVPAKSVPAAKIVQLTFGSTPAVLPISGTNTINVAVRVQSQGVAVGTGLVGTITAFYEFGNPPLIMDSFGDGWLTGLGMVEGPATTVTLAEGPENVPTCIGVKDIPGSPLENDFSLRIAENWNDALTSLSDEYTLENNDASNLAGSATPSYPTNGSNILITLSGIPEEVGVVARKPRPCVNSPARASNYCASGNLTIGDPVALAGTAPYGGTQAFWYQVITTNVGAMEFADFGFRLWSKGPLPPNQGYEIMATVSLTGLYPNTVTTAPPNGDMPWFSSPETASPLPVRFFFDAARCRAMPLR
jgi:hypothetical protein